MSTQWFKFALGAALALASSHADAQDAASRASAASIVSLSVLPTASFELIAASGRLTLVALRPLGHAVEVVLHTSVAGGEVVLQISREAAAAASLAVGTTIEVSSTAAGCLLLAGGAAIAFIPNALVAPMVHRQEVLR